MVVLVLVERCVEYRELVASGMQHRHEHVRRAGGHGQAVDRSAGCVRKRCGFRAERSFVADRRNPARGVTPGCTARARSWERQPSRRSPLPTPYAGDEAD